MTLQIYEELEQGSNEWSQARCGLVTASVVGLLMSPKTLKPADNETSRGLMATLVAERITGRVEPAHETWDMTRGTLSEAHARDIYAEHIEPVEEIGFMVREFAGFKIGYSPDGLTEEGLVEIKSPRAKSHVQTLISDQVPSKYLAQLHTGMLVSDRPHIDFISYHPGHPLYVRRVHRDEAWDQAIIDTVAAFEDRAEQMSTQYKAASQGRPPTPWVDVFEEEEFELIT